MRGARLGDFWVWAHTQVNRGEMILVSAAAFVLFFFFFLYLSLLSLLPFRKYLIICANLYT